MLIILLLGPAQKFGHTAKSDTLKTLGFKFKIEKAYDKIVALYQANL